MTIMNSRHQIINTWAHLTALNHSNFNKNEIFTSWPYNVTMYTLSVNPFSRLCPRFSISQFQANWAARDLWISFWQWSFLQNFEPHPTSNGKQYTQKAYLSNSKVRRKFIVFLLQISILRSKAGSCHKH